MEAREAKKYGMELGAYNGANKRRFVLFTTHDAPKGHVVRHEFDTKGERDAAAEAIKAKLAAVRS